MRGRLTIFFGAAPGVGKTYTMLEAARIELSDQVRDVAVGIVETHGRYDTGALLMGLELLPRREGGGARADEFDLDRALARRPALVLVDELAHENPPGARHRKRWQDVDELLHAGIDVFTTLNVQHLESLNDVVAQITGVVVRETVPDSVFDTAYEVRVVDLPVDQLLERLKEGKAILSERAAEAVETFFKEGNLIALRELALRRTAERVEAKMRGYKVAHGIEETWHTGERVLVCVSPSPHAARLVRAARRMATSLHAELVGVYVETPRSFRMKEAGRERLARTLRLVEALGGEAVTLRAEDAAAETVRYARVRNVTKIVVGKPRHSRWRDLLGAPFLDALVRSSREIDVYVISGGPEERTEDAEARPEASSALAWAGYSVAAIVLLLAILGSWSLFGRGRLVDVFAVIVLGGTSVVIGQLTRRIRDQADSARDRERRTASLSSVSRELGAATSREASVEVAVRSVREVFHAQVALLLPAPDRSLRIAAAADSVIGPGDSEMDVAEWVWAHEQPAGAGTDTLPLSRGLYVPLLGSRGRVGVLGLFAPERGRLDDPDERQFLSTLGGLIGSALERAELADEARRASLRIETEQLRNALLSSVSHDLRTPLGVITGATSALLDDGAPQDESTRRELLRTAHEEALRLSRLVSNLLDMTRLDAGALTVQREPQPVEEVIGAALNRVEDRLRGREVRTDVPSDLPLAMLDPVSIEQVLINLLENATKYSPAGSPLEVAARKVERELEVEVADRGPGVPAGDAERVFDKFYRAREAEGGGVGLGLTICRGIVSAHGGKIWVEARPGGGASFRFTLPLETA